MLRLSPVLTCSRTLRSVVVKPGSVPRRLIAEARPSARCEVNPGRRAIDSAMLVSGSFPMSSAEMASTMLPEFSFTLIASSMPRRMPVTTTSCSGAFSAGVSCAAAGTATVTAAMRSGAHSMGSEIPARSAPRTVRLGMWLPLAMRLDKAPGASPKGCCTPQTAADSVRRARGSWRELIEPGRLIESPGIRIHRLDLYLKCCGGGQTSESRESSPADGGEGNLIRYCLSGGGVPADGVACAAGQPRGERGDAQAG